MRPHVLLLFLVFGAVVFSIFSASAQESPVDEAKRFLERISAGDMEGALREFGDNTCHCAPKGGYIAYLRYEDAQDPTLAFIFDQHFRIAGEPRVKQLPFNGEKYVFPWDKPEDVSVRVPIEFPINQRPYFLPLDTAFGHEISDSELKQFEKDPSQGWLKGFTLRVRPTLDPGFIKPPHPQVQNDETAKDVDEKLLPPEITRYLHPKDPAPIKLASGETVPATTVSNELPRLKSITIGLKIVRRGSFRRWTVKRLGIEDPVLVSNGQEVHLHE